MTRLGYKECPVCGEWIREKAKLCRFCGAVLTDEELPARVSVAERDQASESEDLIEARFEELGIERSLRHRRRLEDFLHGAEEQYRNASVLFVDINGYTAMCEKVRAENVKDILDAYYNICTHTVDFYNGFVLEFQGDGCLAVFGAPVAYDRDAESAVRAACEIRLRMEAFPPMHGQRVTVSCAVETGEILSSVIKTRSSVRYKVFGSTVNLASRIQHAAGVNTLLVGPATRELVKSVFDLRERPAEQFKNVERPVVTYEVVGVREGMPARRDMSVAFVGRTRELAKLDAVWAGFVGASAKAELAPLDSRVAVISGEPGAGKTRLCLQFAATRGGRSRLVAAEGAPYDIKIPWGLWRSVVAAILGDPAIAAGQADWKRTGERLGELAAAKDEVPILLAILGETRAVLRASGLAPRALVRQACAAIRGLLGRCAADAPVVLRLDDLQWCDPTSLEVLGMLVADSPQRVFFLISHRTGFDAAIPGLRASQRIALGGLDQQSRVDLFNLLADVHEFAPELRDELVGRAAGNPFYLGELVRAWLEHGQGASASDRSGFVPLSLKEMLQARIDVLDQRRRLVLQCGAVIGRRFMFQIIDLFRLIREGLLARLYSLKSLSLLDDEATRQGLEFYFLHHVTREVAYQSLLERHRTELHKMIAESIEERLLSTMPGCAAVLAYHFGQANEDLKATSYLKKAGDQAAAVAGTAEAIESYTEALDRLSKLPESPDTIVLRVELLRARGRILRFAGDYPGALAALDEGLLVARRLRRSDLPMRLRLEKGLVEVATGRHDEAAASLRFALASAKKTGDKVTLGYAWNALASCAWQSGCLDDVVRWDAKVTELGVERTHPVLAADARNNLALVAWKRGDLTRAATLFREALRLYRAGGEKFGICVSLMNLGIIEENTGRCARAEKRYREALELAGRTSFRQVVTAVEANVANLCMAKGRHAEAVTHSARSLEVAKAIGDRRSECIALENLGLSRLALGFAKEARGDLAEAARIAGDLTDPERVLSVALAQAELALAGRRFAVAVKLLGDSWSRVGSDGFTSELPRWHRLDASLKLAKRETAAAAASIEAGLAEARRQGNSTELARLLALRGEPRRPASRTGQSGA